MPTFIGIDLGTTYSGAARIDSSGRPVMIPNAEGAFITPSVVWFGTNPPTVGQLAKNEQQAGATDIAAFFKRNMGDPYFSLFYHDRAFTPVDLSALVLAKIKADCEAALRDTVTDAVITVPAYFTNTQRETTMEAGRLAGLNVLRIINEPTAAALAYGIHQTGRDEIVLVYDLGGGTFDVTLVKLTPTEIDVLATAGDRELGGKDWDDKILRYLAQQFQDEHGFDPLAESDGYMEFLHQCEKVKQRLSSVSSAKATLEQRGCSGQYEITRAKFESLTADLMQRTGQLVESVLTAANLGWRDLSNILLVGGSTRMPMVREYLEAKSGQRPREGIEVDHAVALGAAVQAALVLQEQQPQKVTMTMRGTVRKIKDVMSHSLGMIAISPDRERYINSILIAKNKPIPAAQELPFKLRTRSGTNNTCEVYLTQGESGNPQQVTVLKKYVFSDIPHGANREAILSIRYAYDENGIVRIAATDTASGQLLPMRIEELPADMTWLTLPPVAQSVPEPVTVYLVIDVSGSMSGSPLAEAQRAAVAFREKCDLSHMSLGLISFDSYAQLRLAACQDAGQIDAAIRGLSTGGSTNMAGGLHEAANRLQGREGPRYLVLLTDGYPDSPSDAVHAATMCKSQGIEVLAIGTGGANVSFLSTLTTIQEGALFAGSGELAGTFSTIAEAITQQSGEGRGAIRLKS